MLSLKKNSKDITCVKRVVNRRITDNVMAKRKKRHKTNNVQKHSTEKLNIDL